MRTKIILLITLISITLCSCITNNKVKVSENIISKDLSSEVTIDTCLYNEEYNAIYVEFYSSRYGDDDAIILLDDESIFYTSVYETIPEDDYAKIIEYGNYAIMRYKLISDGEGWEIIK